MNKAAVTAAIRQSFRNMDVPPQVSSRYHRREKEPARETGLDNRKGRRPKPTPCIS
jgi:hypothetical protein